jgi:hypothetical protein
MSPSNTLPRPSAQVPDESTHYVILVPGGTHENQELPPPPSATGALRGVVGRFYAMMAPFAIAASLFAPAEPRMITRVRSTAGTGIYEQAFPWLIDQWKYMPEYITVEQVEDLRQLLATPPMTDVGFDFRSYPD